MKLKDERYDYRGKTSTILKIKEKSLNVLELINITKASESTIRRDLLELDHQGLLKSSWWSSSY